VLRFFVFSANDEIQMFIVGIDLNSLGKKNGLKRVMLLLAEEMQRVPEANV